MLRKGKRLLDLILGSDAPDYKNEMISSNTIFNLSMSKNDTGYKPLMKKMVFTGLSSLDKTIDVSGSAKLQEFRALKTRIPNVYLADGAPLHTLHLPNTIRGLSLVQNNELTRILTSAPDVWNASSPDDYKGLYIQGLTDASAQGTGHSLASISIDGGGLGYDAYKLLEKYVLVKTTSANNTNPNAGDKVRIGMTNQQWTPYVQVENGEFYNPEQTYYFLNDHGMFDTSWSFTTPEDWAEQTLNGTLYTIDANKWNQKDTITDYSLFTKFVNAYNAALSAGTESKWGMKEVTSTASVPTITGTIFINNDVGSPIDEILFDKNNPDGLAIRWPNLKFTAAHIATANLSKYVRTYESGKVEVLTIGRTKGTAPTLPTDLLTPPSQPYYDFAGWSLSDPNKVENAPLVLEFNSNYTSVDNMYTTTEAWNALAFDENTTVLTFYAVFHPHVYMMTFKYEDETVIDTVGTPYGSPIVLPSVVPYQDESNLAFEEKYAFLGYAYTPDAITPLDMSKVQASRDTTFYALFDRTSVYSNPIPNDYLVFTKTTITLDEMHYTAPSTIGLEISLNTNYHFQGKITLPTEAEDPTNPGTMLPVVAFLSSANGGFANNGRGGSNNAITHIFWDRSGNRQASLLTTGNDVFANSKYKYVELPATCQQIGSGAFYGAEIDEIDLSHILGIENGGFNSASLNMEALQLTNVGMLGQRAFGYQKHGLTFIFGSENQNSRLYYISSTTAINRGSGVSDTFNAIVYGSSQISSDVLEQLKGLIENCGGSVSER